MRPAFRISLITASVAAILALPAAAQQPNTLIADVVKDLGQVQEKLVSLGKVIPADKWGWRPGEGVRSVGEVIRHVTADNYLLPAGLGTPPPAAAGIDPSNYPTVQAFEARQVPKDAAVAEMESSFGHLKRALEAAASAPMSGSISMFGQEFTRQSFLILIATHLHEHLGQLIAYARSVGVVPPWSRGP